MSGHAQVPTWERPAAGGRHCDISPSQQGAAVASLIHSSFIKIVYSNDL